MQKYVLGLGLLVLLGFWGFTLPTSIETNPVMETAVTDQTKLVLVELFTSQGCSSCPPADQVLHQLDEDAQAENLPVIALSYHVDYWNRLGWKDPYSSADFSQRQRTYAGKINDQGVYTPQIIVNGQRGYVGSREREIRSAIATASSGKERITITAHLEQTAPKNRLHYELSGKLENIVLNIALVESSLENDVPRGENRGKLLSHTNVVRQLITIDKPEVKESLTIPTDLFSQAANGKIVLFAQAQDSWEVLGVTAFDF